MGRKSSPASPPDLALRNQLASLLQGGGAHVTFEQAMADWVASEYSSRPAGAEYSAWMLLEHLRIAQWDILGFSRDPGHVSPPFPSGYWPAGVAPPHPGAWEESLQQFRSDLEAMVRLVQDPSIDLLARIPHGNGQTVLREALVLADHNAYHMGQLVLLKKLLSTKIE